MLGRDLGGVDDVLFRDDQDVGGRDRADVPEGVDEIGGQHAVEGESPATIEQKRQALHGADPSGTRPAPEPGSRLPTGGRSRQATSLASRRPRTVSTLRPSALSTRPESASSSARAADSTPSRVRTASSRASSRRWSGSRRSSPATALRLAAIARCNAPGRRCSRTCGRRGGCGPHSRRRGSRPGASSSGCAGTRGRAATSWRSRTRRARRPRGRRRRARSASPGRRRRDGGSGRARAACPARPGARRRSRGAARARGRARPRRLASQSESLSSRRPVDEVHAVRGEADLADGGDRAGERLGPCRRPSDGKHVGGERLHPERDAVHPCGGVGAQQLDGVTSSGLHSTVTSAPSRRSMAPSSRQSSSEGMCEGVPPPKKTVAAAPRPPAYGVLELGQAGVDVARDELLQPGPGGKGAVVAATGAEGHVHVDAESTAGAATGLSHEGRRGPPVSSAGSRGSGRASRP